jgi:hypothetical protein
MVLCLSRSFVSAQTVLTTRQINEDLDQLVEELEGRAAYLTVNSPDYRGAIEAVRDRAAGGMELLAFSTEIRRVLGLLIDSHAGVRGFGWPEDARTLPFNIIPVDGHHVAVQNDHSAFVDDRYPYIREIDGIEITEWLGNASQILPKGSKAYLEFYSTWMLRNIQFFRALKGMETKAEVEIRLESKDGKEAAKKRLDLVAGQGGLSPWPDRSTKIIENNVAYMRITSWSPGVEEEFDTWMERFKSTEGLIIDLRGNTGGNRNTFKGLFPYFRSETDPPVVGNAVKLRLNEEFTSLDLLTLRLMRPYDWDGWNPAERNAIAEFRESFQPEWTVPVNGFSDWHYWVLSRQSNPKAYHYENPVVFLMDRGSFSATDVVLASVKGLENITLMGTPSGGGSGAAFATTLVNSGLQVQLSSMVSFQKNGSLIDSRGIEPDIHVEPFPEFYVAGGRDVVLERAIELITNHHR